MFDRYTDGARKVMRLARQEAQRLNHSEIDVPHIFLGLLLEDSGFAARALHDLGVQNDTVKGEIEKVLPPVQSIVSFGIIPPSSRAKKVLEVAVEEAKKLEHNYIGTEHLLLALIHEERGIDDVVTQVLCMLDVTLEQIREKILEKVRVMAGKEGKDPAPQATGKPNFTLTRHGVKLRIAQLQDKVDFSAIIKIEEKVAKKAVIEELRGILLLLPKDEDVPGLSEALQECSSLIDRAEQAKKFREQLEKGGMTDEAFLVNIRNLKEAKEDEIPV